MIKKISKKAFTLIELMLVMVIISILATSAMTSLGRSREKARDIQRIANSRQMVLALELYYDNRGGYPADEIAGDDDWDLLISELEKMEIMQAAPIDRAGEIYHYYPSATSTSKSYVLGIKLENEDHPNLINDMDGFVYGLDCDDPIYCLKP